MVLVLPVYCVHLRRATFVQCVVHAQTLRKLWASKSGLSIPNRASTSPALRNDGTVQWCRNSMGFAFSVVFQTNALLSLPSPTAGGSHAFMWRDLFDVAVRWRQIADPYDPVYVENHALHNMVNRPRIGACP